jgi:hypothetical protein
MIPESGCPDLAAANALDPGPQSYSVRKAWEGNNVVTIAARKTPANGANGSSPDGHCLATFRAAFFVTRRL